MKPFDYLLCQMDLEGIQRVPNDLIIPGAPGVEEFPLVITARTSDGESLICFDASIPTEIRLQLPLDDLQAFRTGKAIGVFERSGIHVKSGHFKTHVFPEGVGSSNLEGVKCFNKDDPKIVDFGFHGFADQVHAIEKAGTILSACVSSRQNSRCAEAWVFTRPDQRRRGYAQGVVRAWADAIKAEGLIPFYSHRIDNMESARLAGRLNLTVVFEEMVIEKDAG
jgi:hypothetical protein